MRADLVTITGLIPGTAASISVLARPPKVRLTPRMRRALEAEAEAIITLLDEADGDPDLEYDGDEFEDSDVREDDDPREDDETAAAVGCWGINIPGLGEGDRL